MFVIRLSFVSFSLDRRSTVVPPSFDRRYSTLTNEGAKVVQKNGLCKKKGRKLVYLAKKHYLCAVFCEEVVPSARFFFEKVLPLQAFWLEVGLFWLEVGLLGVKVGLLGVKVGLLRVSEVSEYLERLDDLEGLDNLEWLDNSEELGSNAKISNTAT